jgi:hypothetical protein
MLMQIPAAGNVHHQLLYHSSGAVCTATGHMQLLPCPVTLPWQVLTPYPYAMSFAVENTDQR